MSYTRWRGVISAITTKLDPAQDVDPAAVAADVAFQLDQLGQWYVACQSPSFVVQHHASRPLFGMGEELRGINGGSGGVDQRLQSG